MFFEIAKWLMFASLTASEIIRLAGMTER